MSESVLEGSVLSPPSLNGPNTSGIFCTSYLVPNCAGIWRQRGPLVHGSNVGWSRSSVIGVNARNDLSFVRTIPNSSDTNGLGSNVSRSRRFGSMGVFLVVVCHV